MEQRRLGSSSLYIPPLVFGGNVLGWSADEATSFRLLDMVVNSGLTAIDTADVYSRWVPGHQAANPRPSLDAGSASAAGATIL